MVGVYLIRGVCFQLWRSNQVSLSNDREGMVRIALVYEARRILGSVSKLLFLLSPDWCQIALLCYTENGLASFHGVLAILDVLWAR